MADFDFRINLTLIAEFILGRETWERHILSDKGKRGKKGTTSWVGHENHEKLKSEVTVVGPGRTRTLTKACHTILRHTKTKVDKKSQPAKQKK